MTAGTDRIRRFTWRHIVNHWVMLVTFAGLAATGLPQKFPDQPWAKGVVLILGGVERTRVLHHLLGTIMALHLVWHLIEALWLHVARRLPMPMVPRIKDLQDFFLQVRYNLGVADQPPRMDRYSFAEKLEYLALVWGTVVMVVTGIILLYPVRWTHIVPGEVILASKAAHGGEAILALLSILTWHVYFVHVRHWNKSIFNGHLEESSYAEEHSLELERIRRSEAPSARVSGLRTMAFALLAVIVVALTVALWLWLATGGVSIRTVP